MKDQQRTDTPETKPPEGEMSKMWAEAAEAFEKICGESLHEGDVKNFEDVQRKIESASKVSYGLDLEQKDKWDTAKRVGLQSLKYLKLLVRAAAQGSSFVPIPASVAKITSTALCFVFEIPEAIKGYNDAINLVFGEVSSALSQFQIYQSMDNVDPLLIMRIHQVMVSFVKLCAHVVKYRQERKRDRFLRQIKSIFDDNSGLTDELSKFRRALQQQRDVEGTIALAGVAEMRKGVQSLNEDADRSKALIKIRDALGLPETVRLDTKTTQTCTKLVNECSDGTGSWIWKLDTYKAWTASKDKDTSHVLLVSGPPSSGKSSVSALITRRLEEQKGRTYVAHYFFSASNRKSDNEKHPVLSALKYMAFQIARVDATVQKTLGKVCDAGALSSSMDLESWWEELKIGTSGSGAMYYLVFDGIEKLPKPEVQTLLKFIFGPKLAAGRVRVLASGADNDDKFPDEAGVKSALQIRMEVYNGQDMRIVIDEGLNKEGMLQHAKPDSEQQKAREKILEKLPQNVQGSYAQLQFGLDSVIRLLSTRKAVTELDRMLDQSISSHEVAIKNLQRSLTVDEISDLNELLKWVEFSTQYMNLAQLEAAMSLSSGMGFLASLEYIIKNKYSAVLQVEGHFVEGKDGVRDYLQKDKNTSGKSRQPKEQPTISMTITINNVDQELCGHFLWDLAHKGIRDKFKFDFDAASNALHNSQAVIALDEFEAHHTIVKQAFKYLSEEPRDQTKEIGNYLVNWLPYHLDRLRQLEGDDKGMLMPDDQLEIGHNLYQLFQDEDVFRRHRASFEGTWWEKEEMMIIQKWLRDWAVVRKLDKRWRDEVQQAVSPTKGYLRTFVRVVVEGFLRERSWGVQNAYTWIEKFMEAEQNDNQHNMSEIDWDCVSTWCQGCLGLPDSELNSLWYERLATAAFSRRGNTDTVLSLYQRALEKDEPSWLCHRSLGETYFRRDQTTEAITQPERKDIVDLHLLLGRYSYEVEDMQKAAEHYLLACESEDEEQAREGLLGYLKAVLKFLDMEGTREVLKSKLALSSNEERIVSILRMIAQDPDHDAIVSKIFTVAMEDLDLLTKIVHIMETATTIPVPSEVHVEGEMRGVLLYDRGVAAYMYKVSPQGTEPISEALRLWGECREQLSDVYGRNAFFVKQHATEALAKHYFQSMVDGQHLDHVKALEQLADDDSGLWDGDSTGFLGALYALRGEQEQSKAGLRPRIKLALQILSDNIPDNDRGGLSGLFKTLAQHLDFENAATALSLLGQPDLMTEALYFEAKDIMDDNGVDKQEVLDIVTKLAKETIQVVKTQVPDASCQIQRIEAAKEHIDSLITATGTKYEVEANVDREARESEDHGEGEQADPDSKTTTAHCLLQGRLSTLHQMHTPQIDTAALDWIWSCDGTPDGKKVGIFYIGPRAKSLKVPRKVRAVEGDEMVLEICYAEDGSQELMVEEWKKKLAEEWDISLEEMFGQAMPEDDVEDETEEGEV
ncbi:Goodbye domain-containing protein [Mycena sanguinolenta]|uniref:Goodbye domain-containing protein n=1 Tax=Mycena sanguinolenta TaxID=230812 RepID=A0A8H6ZKK1_9AGAR|nr:Goodbye domain-containing protein [Mycena sanguinolenta]